MEKLKCPSFWPKRTQKACPGVRSRITRILFPELQPRAATGDKESELVSKLRKGFGDYREHVRVPLKMTKNDPK